LGVYTYTWGGFAEYVYTQNTVPYLIPDDIPDEVAVFTDTLVSVWGTDRALNGMPAANEGLFWGKSAFVQGAGPIGIAAAMKLKEYNVENLIMVGGPEWRLKETEKFGVVHIINMENHSPKEREEEVHRLTGGRGADLVFEGAGVPSAFTEAFDLVRRGGLVIEAGHFTDAGTVPINPYKVCYKDCTLICLYGFGYQ
jgi:L-iditol 2-dehydrogenase